MIYFTESDLSVQVYTDEEEHQLIHWYKQWELDTKVIDLLPKTGWIINNVGAIFLYETNSKVAFLDGFISNKRVKKEYLTIALDKLVRAACKHADEKGFKMISATTILPAVVERSKKFGFKVTGKYDMLIREK